MSEPPTNASEQLPNTIDDNDNAASKPATTKHRTRHQLDSNERSMLAVNPTPNSPSILIEQTDSPAALQPKTSKRPPQITVITGFSAQSAPIPPIQPEKCAAEIEDVLLQYNIAQRVGFFQLNNSSLTEISVVDLPNISEDVQLLVRGDLGTVPRNVEIAVAICYLTLALIVVVVHWQPRYNNVSGVSFWVSFIFGMGSCVRAWLRFVYSARVVRVSRKRRCWYCCIQRTRKQLGYLISFTVLLLVLGPVLVFPLQFLRVYDLSSTFAWLVNLLFMAGGLSCLVF